METSYDPSKRIKTLKERGLDFEDAGEAFSGLYLTVEDDRFDYGEVRYQTIGESKGNIVMVVWTPRADQKHIISMRKCNAKERTLYQKELERSG